MSLCVSFLYVFLGVYLFRIFYNITCTTLTQKYMMQNMFC